MQSSEVKKSKSVMLIGNNPIDLSDIYDRLKRASGITYVADIFFDAGRALKKVMKTHPNFIVVDDNIDRRELKKLLTALKGNEETMEIPITIVQNSNRDDISRDGAEEFILKSQITSESIKRTLTNSLKISRMQAYLRLAHRKRKKMLRGIR